MGILKFFFALLLLLYTIVLFAGARYRERMEPVPSDRYTYTHNNTDNFQ